MSADISTYYILSLEYMLFKSCKISILLALFFKLSMSIDLIICQIDRFLALYLNAKYNNFMTAQIALDICLTRFRLFIVKGEHLKSTSFHFTIGVFNVWMIRNLDKKVYNGNSLVEVATKYLYCGEVRIITPQIGRWSHKPFKSDLVPLNSLNDVHKHPIFIFSFSGAYKPMISQ